MLRPGTKCRQLGWKICHPGILQESQPPLRRTVLVTSSGQSQGQVIFPVTLGDTEGLARLSTSTCTWWTPIPGVAWAKVGSEGSAQAQSTCPHHMLAAPQSSHLVPVGVTPRA